MAYQHVVSASNGNNRATALVGMHSILVGFDFTGTKAQRNKLLGFAVHRTDLTANEAVWLCGQKRFKDQGDYGEDVPSSKAPFQTFHWSDYTAKPGHRYEYRVHSVFGTKQQPELRDMTTLKVEAAKNTPGVAGVYFNRGVTAALAYRKRFGDVDPEDVIDGSAFRWLSRGLLEGLADFIASAQSGDELKVCIYEFEYEGAIDLLKAAKQRGVKLYITYHAKPGDKRTPLNTKHVNTLNLPASRVKARTNVPNISHNKFVVHRSGGKPIKVWTGSTNWTDRGFYLQTNVGLVFNLTSVANAFDAFFDVLSDDPVTKEAKGALATLTADVASTLPQGWRMFFSPVAGDEQLRVAAKLIDEADDAVFFSSPFGLDGAITAALNANAGVTLEYGLVNVTNFKKLVARVDRSINSWITQPASLKKYDGRLWDAEARGNHKIHVKSMVVDPWSDNPKVLIGSANFSDESVNKNDENAFLIEGDGRLAAIVTTEFLRMFDHYKFRDWVRRAEVDTSERFLAEDGAWTADYYDSAKGKYRERMAFAQS
ncbi:MAG: phospholipase D-like domain-containing protein [Planctomycetota bacterium]|nr:phospholipase D-like domain-containing protein [Planctomycetota bacterium]